LYVTSGQWIYRNPKLYSFMVKHGRLLEREGEAEEHIPAELDSRGLRLRGFWANFSRVASGANGRSRYWLATKATRPGRRLSLPEAFMDDIHELALSAGFFGKKRLLQP
jgi:hypothetical protein